jgi:hypothetical protein
MEDPTQNNTLHEYYILAKLKNIMCKNLVSNRIGLDCHFGCLSGKPCPKDVVRTCPDISVVYRDFVTVT